MWIYEDDSLAPLAQISLRRGDTEHDAEVYWYHNDVSGMPRELTGAGGEIAWRAEYRAWGNTLRVEHIAARTGEPVYQPLRYQGQYFDAETGLHYNRFRYYDPDAGRFISQDPPGPAGGINLYQYAPNPLVWVDPLGLTNLNTNTATGNFGVYEIRIDGELYKYGKADLNRITISSGLPTRLHQQVRKLRDLYPDKQVVGTVLEEGYESTSKAKSAETARLDAHYESTGEVPEGNKKSYKPKGKCDL